MADIKSDGKKLRFGNYDLNPPVSPFRKGGLRGIRNVNVEAKGEVLL
ncbi:MAG: hypothetical protein SCARUB_04264 [Candidatus Scalindua rubra]|uniref:Uncharacterized protein n=1 Tax=Candidatus Scalindua rubra TaxID=1872076 RepID=A0A1E3X4U1_9BACT|nr:MAG: hypothetical protein SCARUB_04264 [Candidatus Scalindua rubra]